MVFVQLDMQLCVVAAGGEEESDWSASDAGPLQSSEEDPSQEN